MCVLFNRKIPFFVFFFCNHTQRQECLCNFLDMFLTTNEGLGSKKSKSKITTDSMIRTANLCYASQHKLL